MLKYAIAVLVAFISAYLVCAFVSWNMDVSTWSIGGRFTLVWIGTALSTLFCGAVINLEK